METNENIRKILVADDNEFVLEFCSELLNKNGYSVETAADGFSALDKIKSSPYDLVITDLNMPRLDGLGLYLRAIKDFPYLKDRFIFIAGCTEMEQEAGAVLSQLEKKILKKPFTINELLANVELLTCMPRDYCFEYGNLNNRKWERAAWAAECFVFPEAAGRAPVAAKALDISDNGIKIKHAGEPFEDDAHVSVYISSPSINLHKKAVIKWSKKSTGSTINGIEFMEQLPLLPLMEKPEKACF